MYADNLREAVALAKRGIVDKHLALQLCLWKRRTIMDNRYIAQLYSRLIKALKNLAIRFLTY